MDQQTSIAGFVKQGQSDVKMETICKNVIHGHTPHEYRAGRMTNDRMLELEVNQNASALVQDQRLSGSESQTTHDLELPVLSSQRLATGPEQMRCSLSAWLECFVVGVFVSEKRQCQPCLRVCC